MLLSSFSVRRPVATVVLVIALMAMGLMALAQLRVNQIPDVQAPLLVLVVPYPGASPETVEREVVDRIEKSLQSVPGVKEVRSQATEGQAQILIFLHYGKSTIEAADEVRNAIASVRYKLPTEMKEPMLQRWDPTSEPVMRLSLSSTTQSHAAISRLAEDDLADRLRAIPGVATVTVNGALERELSVLLRADRLREMNLSVAEVLAALRGQNLAVPVGRISGTVEDRSIRLVGRLESPEEFAQLVVRRVGDQTIRLGQVAEVRDGFAELESLSLRNGKPNVGLEVTRARDASAVSVGQAVHKLVGAVAPTLARGTVFEVVGDGGKDAQSSLDNVVHALIFGAGLTVFVVYLFLNSWRSTLITALSLPTSAITAFIAVWASGFTLNFMTLLGLSLAIGVLIDDAIVVRENIVRHLERGEDRRTAALNGTAEIGLAVASTTFSIIAVFVPVAFMPGLAGEWFRPFALTVVSSVLVSLLVSFTLDPMLSAWWGDPPGHDRQPRRGLGALLQRFNQAFDRLADRYGKVIAWALHHRVWMFVIATLSLGAAVGLQLGLGGSSFLPPADYGIIAVDVRAPAGSSLEHTRVKVEQAASLALTLPEVLATDASAQPGSGKIYVRIGDRSERKPGPAGRVRSSFEIAADLRARFARLVGAEYAVLDDLDNGAEKPVQILFYGQDERQLMQLAQQFVVQMRAIKGAVDVGLSQQAPRDELRVELRRGLASALGISVADAAQALRVAFAGIEAGDWIDPNGKARDVQVRLRPEDRVDAAHIGQLPVALGTTGQAVMLAQVADITISQGPTIITHQDGRRTLAVAANVQGRSSGEVTADAQAAARAMRFPPGYGVQLDGASRDQEEIFTSMATALVLGIGLMYLVLVMQFGSFTAPLPVMFSLPLSLIGVVLALLATGSGLNLMSLIGVIMLMGLVAKNAILLLDAARELEHGGMPREEALMAAGRKRLRPILMTTVALVAGMLPVAIGVGDGGEFYRPMAVAIIGGTITSTLLTLLVIPSFYDSVEIRRDRFVGWLRRRVVRAG